MTKVILQYFHSFLSSNFVQTVKFTMWTVWIELEIERSNREILLGNRKYGKNEPKTTEKCRKSAKISRKSSQTMWKAIRKSNKFEEWKELRKLFKWRRVMKVQQWTISIKWWKTENIHTPFKQIKIYTLIRSISQTSVKLLKKKLKWECIWCSAIVAKILTHSL